MPNRIVDELNHAAKNDDLEALQNLIPQTEGEKPPVRLRAFNLLGSLYARRGDRDASKSAFQKSWEIHPEENLSGAHGLMIAYAAEGNVAALANVANKLLTFEKYSENIFSRCLLLCAQQELSQISEQFFRRIDIEQSGTIDARVWFRCAKAHLLLGNREKASAFAKRAMTLADGDPDLQLTIATIDYDINDYWERRYNTSQGARTPVLESEQTDEAFLERTERDFAMLHRLFENCTGDRIFAHGADCGCGSGRITPFLLERCRKLDSFDISKTAIEFAIANHPALPNASFRVQNLSEQSLETAQYDLVFDYIAVQHVADRAQWESTLRNYANACCAGGLVFLVEAIGDGQRKDILHVSNARPEDYVNVMNDCGLSLKHQESAFEDHVCLVFEKQA